jgi:hypothetical protein
MTMTFERSVITDKLVQILRGTNDEVSYKSLANQVDVPIGLVKSTLASARRILTKEKILFGAIRGIGLKRLADIDKSAQSDYDKKRLRRASSRYNKKLDTIEDFNRLPNIEQLRVTTNRTIFSLIHAQTHTSTSPPRSPTTPPDPQSDKLIDLFHKDKDDDNKK